MTSRSMTRRRYLALTPAAGAAIVVACTPGGGGGSGSAPAAGPIQPGTKVTLADSNSPDVHAIYERHFRMFEQKHPGVTFELVSTQGQNHMEKVVSAMAAGTPYDIFRLSPNSTPTLAERGQIRSIDDLVRRDKYDLSDFFEKCLAQYNWKGKLYAVPRGFGNQDVYYNVAVLEAAGVKRPPYDWNSREWTVDDFLDAATRVSRLSTGTTRVWGWQQGRGLRAWAPWVWIFGGDILDKDSTKSVLDQQPAVDGLQFLQDLMYRHQVMPPPNVNVNIVNSIGNGQLGMGLGIPANLRNYRAIQGLNFDVAPMPRKATRMTSGGGVAWHMAAGTTAVNAAWEMQKLLASKEVHLDECADGTTAPPRKSVLRSPCFVDRTQPPRGIDVFVQAPEFVHPDPQAVGWDEIETELDKGLAALWDGSKTARQVVQEIVPQVNRIIAANRR